jgi:tRNA-specific 2-thiouridylase
VLGRHDGAYAFTVGQRRGLRLGVPAGDGKPGSSSTSSR